MADAARVSPLKRRLAPPRPVRGVGDGAVEKLLRVEVPRAADQLLAVQADVQAVTVSKLDHAGVVAALGPHDLICLMTRDAVDVGLLVVDLGLLTALIEVQTLGKVTSAPLTERTPTRTDAVVVSDILDKWMTDVSRAADEAGLSADVPFHGYAREHGILGLRAVELTLDPGQYKSMRITISLGGDAKTGALTFFAPASRGGGPTAGEASLGIRLRPALMNAPAEMQAILARVQQPLSKVLGFKLGDVVPVDAKALTRIQLEVSQDVPVVLARLGQVNGFRAVRLTRGAMDDDNAPFFGVASGGKGTFGAQVTLPEREEVVASTEALSALPDFPDLPDLQDFPADAGGMADLPGLPALGGFPDLPDLPDLPEP